MKALYFKDDYSETKEEVLCILDKPHTKEQIENTLISFLNYSRYDEIKTVTNDEEEGLEYNTKEQIWYFPGGYAYVGEFETNYETLDELKERVEKEIINRKKYEV